MWDLKIRKIGRAWTYRREAQLSQLQKKLQMERRIPFSVEEDRGREHKPLNKPLATRRYLVIECACLQPSIALHTVLVGSSVSAKVLENS